MNKKFLATVLALVILTLGGCGSGDDVIVAPLPFTTRILSNPTLDGDIAKDATGAYAVTQGNTQSVYVGIDPFDGAELRAFLDFPLTGPGGVPGKAIIVSATLDFVVNSIVPNPLVGTIPIRIDLVNFQPPTLIGTDFDRTIQPALATVTIVPPISQADFGGHVPADVTPLMVEAQRLGLANFQMRILRDDNLATPGLIEINDTTGVNRNDLAPLLIVTYY